MGFLDNLKGKSSEIKEKATDAVDKHGDKIAGGIDKAADFVNTKTNGKLGDKADKVAEKAKDALDKLDGKNDDIK
ncbi:antitoxin [Nocardioides dubius]|uniref:Antitoxin n=1 Tax=Nocardioides dubius TaxID=317019 RepID=A0ABN1TT51_9ACTN